MNQVVLNREMFEGCPTLLELAPSVCNIPEAETLDIRWENSKPERVLLNQFPNYNFNLYVPDLQASVRATATLGLPLNLDKNMVGTAHIALTNKKLYNWRGLNRQLGPVVMKNVVLKIAADEIRKGSRPKLAAVAKDILLDGVNAADADVLLRLRVLRGF